ncbi:IPT/TIG domain-containing protein [Paradonghicola geojensis]|nr:IPT/TIG domain-containing protein [Marivivens geojensis]
MTSVSPTNGLVTGGTIVTISGTSLGCVSVSFNGVSASNVTASYGTVTATSPVGTIGVVTLKVTNPNVGINANAFDTAQFTYIAHNNTPTTASVIQSDVSRVTRSAVTANNSMMSQGLERFIGDRSSGQSMTDVISTSGLNSVVVSPEMKAYGETLFGRGSFFGQSVSADGTYRKVTFGEFDVQHERGAGTTLSFNGRMAWERAAGDDAMVAYFLGAEVNRSNLEGTYTGDQSRYGLTAGVYGFKELENNLYLSGYGSLGVARSNLDITDGASSVVTGDYTSRTMSLGGQLSGSVDFETYELRPSVSLNFVKTWIGDITLDENGSSINVAVGDTTFGELVAKPEFLFPMEQQEGSNMVTVASAAPRLICERSDAANTVTKDCGAGLELGINGTSEDGATNLNASIRFDRVGGVDRQGLNLQAEFRF